MLSALLAATTLSRRRDSVLETATVASAVVGAAFAVAGSAPRRISGDDAVSSSAGFVSSLGFALIGAWLVAVNRSAGGGAVASNAPGAGPDGRCHDAVRPW